MACINPNTPEFKAVLERTGNPLLAEMELDVPSVKPGVRELFQENPELAALGTPEQYSQYLDTIFPESKVRDIVYHGSTTFEPITKFNTKRDIKGGNIVPGAYFTKNKTAAANYRSELFFDIDYETGETFESVRLKGNLYSAVLDFRNPLRTEKRKNLDNSDFKGYDSAIVEEKDETDFLGNVGFYSEYIAFEPEQIHILGSDKDAYLFATFVEELQEKEKKQKDVDLYLEQAYKGNSQISNIGTFKQYKNYLNSKFPNRELLFHGTTKGGEFEVFDKSKFFAGEGRMAYGAGFYLTENKSSALQYSQQGIVEYDDDENALYDLGLIEYRKAIEEWKKSDKSVSEDEYVNEKLRKFQEQQGFSVRTALVNTGKSIYTDSSEYKKIRRNNDDFETSRILQEMGYDSINHVVRNTSYLQDEGDNQYIVFESDNIHILGTKQDVQGFKEFVSKEAPSEPMFQLKGTEGSKASPATIKLIKQLLNRIGVKYDEVKDIVVNGKVIDANAVANITQRLIQYVEGRGDVTLPEEAMHFVVEIIQQTNPELFRKLLSEINQYQILNQVFADYANNPYYQKDGKPDVLKLKKEAIGKVLAETVINKQEGYNEKPELLAKSRTWWQSIIEFLKGLFVSSGFDQAAMKIISGEEIGTVEDIRAAENEIYLSESSRDVLYNRLKAMSSRISKKGDEEPDEKKRGYYIGDRKIARRVTDIVNDWYERRFKEKQLTKSEYQKSVFDLKAEKGTAGHKDFENAFDLFVDEEGFLRPEPLDDSGYESELDPMNRDMYETLRDNLKERLNSFPKGTRFLKEMVVYDERRDLAGTIDFLAITEDGKVNLLDWKFMDLNIDKYEDVPWYKVNAWRQQMQQYKIILERAYGVANKDFGQTRMIPIKAHYSPGNAKEKILPTLLKVEIGEVNVDLIEDSYLIPVGLEEETTGNKEIDDLLVKLNGLYRKFSEQKVTPDEREEKKEQLNSLFSAIRKLQMKRDIAPLVYQAKLLNARLKKTISTYDAFWKGTDPKERTDASINDFYEQLETLNIAATKTYSSLDLDLDFIFEDRELTEDDIKKRAELRNVADETRRLVRKMDTLEDEFVEKFVAGREGISEILKPEKVIKGLAKWFGTTSLLQTRAMSVLYRKANRALAYSAMEAIEETRRLQSIKDRYDVWAREKGISAKNYFDILRKKDKNQLIDEYKKEFYINLDDAISDRNFEWIRKNVDHDAYRTHLAERLRKELERIDSIPEVTEDDVKMKERKKKEAQALYNIDSPTSTGWLLYDDVKKFPVKDTWETDEWKNLFKKDAAGNYVNQPAVDLYNYIKERNEYFASIGYITKKDARVFLPFVRKGLMEKLVIGGKVSLGEQFLRAISIDEGDIGYGARDPLSGDLIDTIPIYLTKDIEGELSGDIFRNMSLFNELGIKFKYLSEIEYQGRALVNIERKKKSIATSTFGKTVYEKGVLQYDQNNDDNTKLIQNMVRSIIYQQKYLESESFDQILGKIGDFGKKFNDKLGMKIFPEDLAGRQITVNKVWDQINNQFQLTALGLNLLSSISNFFGGSFQSTINAGKYFTRTDFLRTEGWLFANKMTFRDQKKYVAALEYFLPLTENYNRELAKKLSVNKLSQENIQEFLMSFMRNSDWFVQTANFYSFLDNSIVVDGKVVNTREYLRSQPEYIDMYAGTEQERRDRMAKFEEDVKKLNEEKGVMKLSTLTEDGRLEIPGVDRKSDSVIEVRRIVQSLNKDALGNLSEDDLRMINMYIFGKSFMVFKNWIPRPIDVRVGNLKYNSATDAYEWGRMRMIFRMLSMNLWKSLDNLYNAARATDKGVDFMRKEWEKKRQEYKEDTGKDLNMTESQFMDLVRHNIKAQVVDAVFMLTLFALLAGLKAFQPDDEEDESIKNSYKFLVRAADKLRDELLFFYDPTSLLGIVSSGIFPSLSYINNFKKLLVNFMKENYAIIVGDQELEDKNYVIKYLMKSFPLANQGITYMPIFYPELAKELGIRPTTESRAGAQ